MMLLSQTLSHFLVGYLVLCLRLLSKGQIPHSSSLVLWNQFKFSSYKKHLIIIQMMIKGQWWMRKKAGRWLFARDGRRNEHSLFIWSPKSPKEHKSRFNLGQKRMSYKRQGRLGTKVYEDSAQTRKSRRLITLEEFFPRKFFQNDSAEAVHTVSRCEIQDKKEDVDHGDPKETLSSLEELQS